MTNPLPTPHRVAWQLGATAAVALPVLIAFNLPPSATFFNQVAALFGWGLFLALVSRVLPVRMALGGGAPALMGALLLIGLAVLVSPILHGLPWGLALQALAMTAAAALAAVVGSTAVRAGYGPEVFRAFCVGVLVAGVATAFVATVQVYVPQWCDGAWIAQSSIPGRAVGNLRQPNHVASLLMWSVVGLVWLGEVRTLGRISTVALGIVLLLGVVLSGSRTGWLGVGVLLLWGALDRRLSSPTRLMLVLAPAVFAALWFGVTEWAHLSNRVFGGESQLSKADISSSRFGIWSNTVALIAQNPWTGVGWGEFNLVWSMTPFPGRPVAFFDHTHNLILQLAVELGLPLAALVLALLGWALWRAWVDAHGPDTSDGAATSSMPRTAFAMVLMILIHSLLEYPLWYSYFLLPAAFAFGLCLGGVPAPSPRTVRAHGQTRPLMVASMVMMLASMAAVIDYMTVVAIFAPPPNPAPLAQRIEAGQRSVLFSHHGDYAAVTTAERPSTLLPAFDGAVQNLLDTRLMMAWANALNESGDVQRGRYVADRLREFRNPLSDEFFAACESQRTARGAKPFQCEAAPASMGYREFRSASTP